MSSNKYLSMSRRLIEIESIPRDRLPTAGELRQVEELVTGLKRAAARKETYRPLLLRARAVQRRINDPRGIQRRDLASVRPAGMVHSSSLSRAGREVLGGLPGTRRGH
ncbi:hypothetical protein [Mycobacterium sp. NPDC004974]